MCPFLLISSCYPAGDNHSTIGCRKSNQRIQLSVNEQHTETWNRKAIDWVPEQSRLMGRMPIPIGPNGQPVIVAVQCFHHWGGHHTTLEIAKRRWSATSARCHMVALREYVAGHKAAFPTRKNGTADCADGQTWISRWTSHIYGTCYRTDEKAFQFGHYIAAHHIGRVGQHTHRHL